MTISNAFESQVARELETKITNFNKKTDFDSLFQVGPTSGEYLENPLFQKFIKIKQTTNFPKQIIDKLPELNKPDSIWGTLTEINRVFVIQGNKIYFWNHFNGSDFIVYEDLKEPCYSLKLVKPKAGIFGSEVKHLLLIFQQSHIQIFGLNFSQSSELRLIQTSISVPTGQIKFNDAVSIQNDRIILGGTDGHLYELIYQLQDDLFNNACRISNLTGSSFELFFPKFITPSNDPVKQLIATSQSSTTIIFSLLNSGKINAYLFGPDSNAKSVGSIGSLVNEAMRLSSTSPYHINSGFKITYMQPTCSSSHQVTIFTTNALRLYVRYRPSFGVDLFHIRRFSPTQAIEGVPKCYYNEGVTIINNTPSSATVSIPCVSSANSTKFVESISSIPLNQEVKAIFNSSPQPLPSDVIPKSLAKPYQVYAPFKTQSTGGPLSYHILTSSSLITFQIRRPIDVLVDIILTDNNIEDNIKLLLSIYNPVELGLMCIAIMTYNPYVLAGDSASLQSYNLTHLQIDQKLTQSATKIFLSLKEGSVAPTAIIPSSNTVAPLGTALFSATSTKSIRLEIILEYFAQLISSFYHSSPFKTQIIKESNSDKTFKVLELQTDYSVLLFVKNNIHKLDSLIGQLEKTMYEFSTEKNSQASLSSQLNINANASNNAIAKYIKQLVNSSDQVISLLEILNTLNLNLLTRGINEQTLKNLESLKFSEFIHTENPNPSIQELISHTVVKSFTFETEGNQLIEILEKKCNLFFSKDKILLQQAQEKLNTAILNPSLVKDLDDARRMIRRAISQLSHTNLPGILDSYFQTGLFEEGLDLILEVAHYQASLLMSQAPFLAKDTSFNTFFISAEDRSNQNTQSYYNIWIQRATHWLQLSYPDLTKVADLKNCLPISKIHSSAINFLSRNHDAILHATIYEWYLQNKWQTLLLEYRTPELTEFLSKYPADVAKQNLLWRILVQQNRPLEAAKSLFQLARRDDVESNLDDRVGYLTSAYNLIQSQPPLPFEHPMRNLSSEVNYTMRLATIQMDILHELSAEVTDDRRRDIDLLNRKLFSDQDLFYTFAVRYELTRPILSIYQLTNIQDNDLLVSLWQKVIHRAAQPHTHPLRQAEAIGREIIQLGTELLNTPTFPVDTIFLLLNTFTWYNKDEVSPKWSTKVMAQCGVPYETLIDLINSWLLQKPQPFDEPVSIKYLEQLLESVLEDYYYDSVRNNRSADLTQKIQEQWAQCKQYNQSQATATN